MFKDVFYKTSSETLWEKEVFWKITFLWFCFNICGCLRNDILQNFFLKNFNNISKTPMSMRKLVHVIAYLSHVFDVHWENITFQDMVLYFYRWCNFEKLVFSQIWRASQAHGQNSLKMTGPTTGPHAYWACEARPFLNRHALNFLVVFCKIYLIKKMLFVLSKCSKMYFTKLLQKLYEKKRCSEK